ncbi:membrane protein [Heyndrickxia sporothermodurans]|nr:membrane protein [Heyndrickxia sporothermodurans]
MKENNLLSSLCYFSIFFAPFLFPIIVYFLGSESVKVHAKKSLWTHLIPYLILLGGIGISGSLGFSAWNYMGIGFVITYIIFIVIGVYFFIWNIVKGIKVLTAN